MTEAHSIDGFLRALGLASAPDPSALVDRAVAFRCLDYAYSDATVGTLLSALLAYPQFPAARSGHLGNWGPIARGAAGALDFNCSICSRDYGFPLIHELNQVETLDYVKGDRVYLPGSLIEETGRRRLRIFTWSGGGLVENDRREPVLSPLALTPDQGDMVPLVDFHRKRMRRSASYRFVSEAQVLSDRRLKLQPVLRELLDRAAVSSNPRRGLQALVRCAVRLDGQVLKVDCEPSGRGFVLAERRYRDAEELANEAFEFLDLTATPRALLNSIAFAPSTFPVLSTQIISLFSAFSLSTLGPSGGAGLHVHWGARDMAGYPPRRRGYFTGRTQQRILQRLATAVVSEARDFSPVLMLLLPAAIFMLCPPKANETDVACVAELCDAIRNRRTPRCATDYSIVEQVTADWLIRRRLELSDYFLDRFARDSGLWRPQCAVGGPPAEPPGFRELTIREACCAVGAIVAGSAVGGW